MIPLKEMINRQFDSINCVDIRTVAVNYDGKWRNAITIIRITDRSASDVNRAQLRIDKKHKLPTSNIITATLQVRDKSGIADIERDLANGYLYDGARGIEIGMPISLKDIKIHSYGEKTAFFDECMWPLYECLVGDNKGYVHSKEIETLASEAGYNDINTFIRNYLEYNYSHGLGGNLGISIPFLLKYEDVKREGSFVKFTIKHAQKDPQNMKVSINVHKDPNYLSIIEKREQYVLKKRPRARGAAFEKVAIKLGRNKQERLISITAIHAKPEPLKIYEVYYDVDKNSRKMESGENNKRELAYISIGNCWAIIDDQYKTSKRRFARKIRFVKEKHKREAIFRDVGHAVYLVHIGMYKSATILAGGVIEELLRVYLIDKGIKPHDETFVSYIKTCEEHKLLKNGIASISHALRVFRNYVHLNNEVSPAHAISNTTASLAVAAMFTIANDFQVD